MKIIEGTESSAWGILIGTGLDAIIVYAQEQGVDLGRLTEGAQHLSRFVDSLINPKVLPIINVGSELILIGGGAVAVDYLISSLSGLLSEVSKGKLQLPLYDKPMRDLPPLEAAVRGGINVVSAMALLSFA